MSLHLANLSSRIRKDELERVFRSFGRCTVQLKDGYGFAVYDFREDAEKALRTLKGRKICGQSVYLSWSKKQPKPKPVQRCARAARPLDTRHGRNSDRGGNFRGRNFSRSHGDYPMSDKHLLDKGRDRHHFVDDDRENFNINDSALHNDQMEGVLGESDHVEFEHNQMDNGRWGEQVDHIHNNSDFDGQMEFDRYDPNFVDKSDEEYEVRGLEDLAGSQSAGISLDKNRLLNPDDKRGQQICFNCGNSGHRMRDCPLDEAFQEKSTYHSDHSHDAKAKSEVRRADSRSGGRLQSSNRDSRSLRRPDKDLKPSHSGKVEIKGRRFPAENESRKDMREDNNSKRRRDRDGQIVETCDDKKSRHVTLSHLHSDCTSLELDPMPRPKKYLVSSSFHSRSASPVSRSPSTSSRSNSRTHSPSSKSYKLKSRSRSRSRSPFSSLSISLGQSLPSSPKKAQINLNDFPEGALSPPSKEVLTKVEQHLEPEVREESLSIANRDKQCLSRNAVNGSSYPLMEVPIESYQHEHDSQNPTTTKDTEMSLNDFVNNDQISLNQESVPNERQGLEHEPLQNYRPLKADVHRLSEDLSSCGKVVGDMKPDQLHNGGDRDSITPQVCCDVEAPSSSLLEDDDKEAADMIMAAQKPRRTEENANDFETTKPLEPSFSKLRAGSYLSISAEELSRVLKHYGLKHPEDNEQHLDVGDYFGSSRLWPWEMIYYRRLKKGPISVENYARRVVQNKAFNITDKYIRSSSGWGELIEEDD